MINDSGTVGSFDKTRHTGSWAVTFTFFLAWSLARSKFVLIVDEKTAGVTSIDKMQA